jgi:hypothetical protein
MQLQLNGSFVLTTPQPTKTHQQPPCKTPAGCNYYNINVPRLNDKPFNLILKNWSASANIGISLDNKTIQYPFNWNGAKAWLGIPKNLDSKTCPVKRHALYITESTGTNYNSWGKLVCIPPTNTNSVSLPSNLTKYGIMVYVPFLPGSTIGVSITTQHGFTAKANIYPYYRHPVVFFLIPPHQGNWVKVCANSGSFSNCVTYSTNNKDKVIHFPLVAYRLKVKVPSPSTDSTTVYIKTKAGFIDEATVPNEGTHTSYTFSIPNNQGNSVGVCVNSGTLSKSTCNTYATTGRNMTVTLFPVAYHLTINVPSHLFGTPSVGISIVTANGYTDQANVLTTGKASWTFNIPPHQGHFIQVCANSQSPTHCVTYQTTGRDITESLSPYSGSEGIVEPAYHLTVNVPDHPFGTQTVFVLVKTANGYTNNTQVPNAGGASTTFNIPDNQGNLVQVCVGSGDIYHCRTYQTTGSDMTESLSAYSGSGSSIEQAYRLTVNVPSHPFGTSLVGISISTKNGYTDEANVPTAGSASYTFNIPNNEGNQVQVCVNFSPNCHTYGTNGRDKTVSFREALAAP